jgi:hypothetical protein
MTCQIIDDDHRAASPTEAADRPNMPDRGVRLRDGSAIAMPGPGYEITIRMTRSGYHSTGPWRKASIEPKLRSSGRHSHIF